MNLETFSDVLTSIGKSLKENRPFHILLGNGFSISYDSDIFSFNALHEFIVNLHDEDLAKILGVIETRNFEVIMQYLDSFSALISAFDADIELKSRVENANRKLRASLLEAVRSLHPEHVFTIPEASSQACAEFLKVFIETGGNLFSTNYDLLLYWVLMRNGVGQHIDGCGRELLNASDHFIPDNDLEWSELTWGVKRSSQNVFYIHGALQFFDNGTSVTKEVYDQHKFLLQRISARMEKQEYPIFVTAGDGRRKLEQIKHNEYLTFCHEALCHVEGSLVTFGFAFGESDSHIIDAINRAAKPGHKLPDRLLSIYIGAFTQADYEHVVQIAPMFKCKVHIFDARTVNVWGN